MKRREFLTGVAAVAGAAMAGCGGTSPLSVGDTPAPENQPNILFMMVDEMRFPTHFPAGINTADEYVERFMPNLFQHIWSGGVKFANYRVAAGACSPSRGVMLTGLYSQQTWVINTITGSGPGGDPPPSMPTEFPTYGRLLQQMGYDTPYFGKFHVTADAPYAASDCQSPVQDYLAPYGFRTYSCPDPAGAPSQGLNADPQTADEAIGYFLQQTAGSQPWCATVSFCNPHDYEFFWGGTEPTTYADLFAQGGATPLQPYSTANQSESNPPVQSGFPPLPPNWEPPAQLSANKPSTQTLFNEANQAIFGGAAFDQAQSDFQLQVSPLLGGLARKGVAPFDYWRKGQDSFLQMLAFVDQQIGRVMDALSDEVRANTVVIFTSDHGDYVGSHGILQGKMGTVYEEAVHVPLVVRDFTGRFATAPDVVRRQLSSSVDLMPFLVTLGNGGSTDWMQGDLQDLYATRHDLLAVVRDANAAGRDFAVYTTDEYVNPLLNFNNAPSHLVALVEGDTKLGVYQNWVPRTTTISPAGRELEFYDYSTTGGQLELESNPADGRVAEQLQRLLGTIIPDEIRRPLPASLTAASAANERVYLDFEEVFNGVDSATVLANIHSIFGQDPR